MRTVVPPMPRVPKYIGRAAFLDVPAYAIGDAGKALTVNPAGDGYVYSAFEAAGAVATHVGQADPHTQYLLESAHTIVSATDFTDTTGVGTDGYSVTWDNGTGKFVLASVTGGGGTPGGADTQVQFNDGGVFGGDAGLVYNKTTNVLTNTGRFVFPKWSPASDSTTALQVTKADGTTVVVTVDTTNKALKLASGGYLDAVGGIDVPIIKKDGGQALDWGGGTHAFRFFRRVEITAGGYFAGSTFAIADGGGGFYAQFHGANTEIQFATSSGAPSYDVGLRRYAAGVLGISNASSGFGLLAIGQSSATALLDLAASTTARASLRVRSGVAPTSPNDGDLWHDNTNIYIRLNGVTKTFTLT